MYRTFQKPRKYIDQNGYLHIDGQFYLGRNRVPPMPNRLALTDRTTGLVRVLSHTIAPRTIDLVEKSSAWTDVSTYGPYDGPYSNDWRLYLDNGTLAFETAPDYNSQRILTRRAFDVTVLEITAATDGTVTYTEVSL